MAKNRPTRICQNPGIVSLFSVEVQSDLSSTGTSLSLCTDVPATLLEQAECVRVPIDAHPVSEAVFFGNGYRTFPSNEVLLDILTFVVRTNLAASLMASNVYRFTSFVSHASPRRLLTAISP
jgi:hypothetical protein